MNCPDNHMGNRLGFVCTTNAATTGRRLLVSIVMLLILAVQATAGGTGELQKYFVDAAVKVKATDNPTEKREILNQTFQRMSAAVDMAKKSDLISKNDGVGLDHFSALLQEKQDELAGRNGFVRVPDERLNAFSDYVVQDSEQADQVITISVVTLLLVLLLVVLLVR